MTAKNLRELLNVNGEYHTFNREERFYAALLYHFLLKPKGLKTFLIELRKILDSINPDFDPEDVGIFFEYAHARDLWAKAKEEFNLSNTHLTAKEKLKKLNARLRDVITSLLNPPEYLGLSKKSDQEFNNFFGAKSKDQIQMPGRWNKQLFPWVEMKRELSDSEIDERRKFAERACTLIWAFNAKADLVIHTGNGQAICIEAKVESAESKYRATANEKLAEREYWVKAGKEEGPYRNFERTQTDIQKFILEELLGYKNTTFVFLSVNQKPARPASQQRLELDWRKVFGWMNPADELLFVRESLESKVLEPKEKSKSRNN